MFTGKKWAVSTEFQYYLTCLLKVVFPIINILHYSRTFATIDEPKLNILLTKFHSSH